MIKDLINNYIDAHFDRYHTPGHGGKLCKMDITELDGGEYFPRDGVRLAQNACAKVFGCNDLRFLVNGSSQGIKASILAVGGDIISASNSHQAISEGAQLAKVQNFIVKNSVRNDLPAPLTLEQVAKAIEEYPSAKAVVITSPDYYGQCSDLKIADYVHERGLILIADSAHGAHFAGSDRLKGKSFSALADFCNMSAHKTLNAYTQTAYLCINNSALLPAVDNALTLLGTTSPSYLFLQQLESASIGLAESNEKYEYLYKQIAEFKRSVVCLQNDDFTRLVIDTQVFVGSVADIALRLMLNKIMPEKRDNRYIILIITPFVTRKMLLKLKRVLCGCIRKN